MTVRPLHALLVAIAVLAIGVPALLIRHAPSAATTARKLPQLPPRRIVPQAELPPVEPVRFVALAPDDARAFNATIPFADGPNPAARPYRFAGGAEDRARATDCLAAAVIYEAGDDTTGERAVAQVILNRLRHPAFPKTVCGVVFEGSERPTGCQFTFACDGALARRSPSPAAWARARTVATRALNGAVDGQVGYATHYHTDWVVPYWQSSLDKIAAVETHLFFRWTGWWGTPAAFHNPAAQAEPAIAKLAALSDAHRIATGLSDEEIAADVTTAPAPIADGGDPAVQPTEAQTFIATLPGEGSPDGFPALAARACAGHPYCKYLAWTAFAGAPAALPITPRQQASMGFSYLRDRERGFDKALWNCQQFKRADPAQCMKPQLTLPSTLAPAVSPAADRGPAELGGVRRRGSPMLPMAPQPAATPAG